MRAVPARASELCWYVVGGILLWALFVPPRTTGDAPGLRRFLTVEAGRDWRIAQRFRMNAADLSAIELRAAAVAPVAGRYDLTLRDEHAPGITRHANVGAADLVRAEAYVFRFRPIQRSAGHHFLLEISPHASDPGRGIALWATKGQRLDEGGLVINHRPRWASLAFQTYTPAVSAFHALIAAHDPDRPPRWPALVGLGGLWISLRFVFKTLGSRDVFAKSAIPSNGSGRLTNGDSTAEPSTPGSDATSRSHDAPGAPPAAVR